MKPPIVDFSEFSQGKLVDDKAGIYEMNPHRHEFALLDGILFCDDQRAVGYFDVPEDSFWVRGHFPGRPLMPGVLISEVAAQLTSYLGTRVGIRGDSVIGLAGLNNVRFRAQVLPGDRLIVMIKLKKSRKGAMIVTEYQVYVDQTLASEGEIKGIAIKDGPESG